MKILIVSQYYNPEQFLINDIAPELVKLGHSVTILTGLPNYPEGKVHKEYRFFKRREETIEGVHVLRCTEIGRHKGKAFLLLNYLSFALFASLKARRIREKFDVVLSYQLSPVTMSIPAIAYKEKKETPILLYCLDLWPESAQAHVKNDKGFLYNKISSLSKSLYQRCDRIAVTSQTFTLYMHQVNDVPEEKLVYLPQHADDSFLESDLLTVDNKITDFVYAGNLGVGQTIDVIINATAILKNRCDFKVHLVGEGSQMATLRQLTAEKGLEDKIIFHGRHPFSKMEGYYKLADALLITLRGNNFVGNTMPGKLQAYMTTGKPVFGAINGDAKMVIEDSGCGSCVASGDYRGLAALMLDYINNPDKYAHCGQKGKNYFKKNFTKQIFIKRLTEELEKTADIKTE